jgi:quinol monooxygenase YgiN
VSFVVAATYQAKPGEEAEVEQHLRAMVDPTRSEEGCEYYGIFRSRDESRVFFLFERYRDETDFDSHKASEHFKQQITEGVWPHLESRSVIFAEEIGV